MAIVKSKVLGLYVLDTTKGQTTAFKVVTAANATPAVLGAQAFTDGLTAGENFLGITTTTGVYLGTFTLTGTSGSPTLTNLDSSLNLQLAATNTNMDISNTVNEVVARDGVGGLSLIHI